VRHPSRRRGDEFGTALMLLENPLQASLWKGDLCWIPMRSADADADRATAELEASRTLEIFLDYLAAQTQSAAYLLNPAYERMLTDPERALAAALDEFVAHLTPEAKSAPEWKRVDECLRSLGWRGPTSDRGLARGIRRPRRG
jgi:hypothetical protein